MAMELKEEKKKSFSKILIVKVKRVGVHECLSRFLNRFRPFMNINMLQF